MSSVITAARRKELLAANQAALTEEPAALVERTEESQEVELGPVVAGAVLEPALKRSAACPWIRKSMADKLDQARRLNLVFFLLVAAVALAVVATLVFVFINATRAASIGTGIGAVVTGSAALFVKNSASAAQEQADKWIEQFDKYHC